MLMSPAAVWARISVVCSLRWGAIGVLELVVDPAEAGGEVQPGGHPVENSDVDLAAGGLGFAGALRQHAQADVPESGLGRDVRASAVHLDGAVGVPQLRAAFDLPDAGVPVGVLDGGRPSDRADVDPT